MDKFVYSVSEFTNGLEDLLDMSYPKTVQIKGEVANMRPSKTHMYFSVSDQVSSISAVVWQSVREREGIELDNGDKVTIKGKLKMYKKNGTYSIHVYQVEKEGMGDLHKQYLKLKKELEADGYFEESKKRSFPKSIIRKIGIVTAADGAALQDVLAVFRNGGLVGTVKVINTLVQGVSCPKSVAKNVTELDQEGCDIILVTRGGGSMDDLFGFSSKEVVESIHNCKTLVLSAVGHEVDFMLSDFVADIRAATPTMGAGMIVAHNKELENQLDHVWDSIIDKVKDVIAEKREEVNHIRRQLDPKNMVIEIDNIFRNIKSKVMGTLADNRLELEKLKIQIRILDKGYCLLFKDGKQIKSVKQLSAGDELRLIMLDGEVVVKLK